MSLLSALNFIQEPFIKKEMDNVKDTRGSALIIVLITMSFITILAVSMVNVSFNERLMAKSFDKSETAYFLAEAGVERAASIIDKAAKIRVDHVLTEEQAYVDGLSITEENKDSEASRIALLIKSHIDIDLGDYFNSSGSASSRFEFYEENNIDVNGDGRKDFVSFAQDIDTFQLIDRNEFTGKNDGVESYYNISIEIGTREADNKRKVIINSYGHYGQSKRHIRAAYYIQDIENIDPKSNTGIYEELYNVFSKKVISSISTTSDSDVWNNAQITGDVLITCNSMTIKNNNTINGELAVKANSIDIQNNLNLTGDTIIDSNNISIGNANGNNYVINGTVFTNNSNFILSNKYPISASDSDVLSGDSSFKYIPSYQLKLLDDIPEHLDDHNNVHYIICKNTGSRNDGIISDDDIEQGMYNVIISSVPLTLNNKTNFNGLIYCPQPISIENKVTIDGIIITNDIKSKNNFEASYKTPSGYLDPRFAASDGTLNKVLSNITNMTKSSVKLDISLDTYSVYCQTWDTP